MTLNPRNTAAIAEARSRLEEVLDDVEDDKLALALVAQLANDFLVRRRESILSRSAAKRAVPKVR